jgi:hypothetical protein
LLERKGSFVISEDRLIELEDYMARFFQLRNMMNFCIAFRK